MSLRDAAGPAGVTVWVADLEVSAARLAALRASLDASERGRESSLRAPAMRARFIAEHGIRREILAAITGTAPQRVRFEYGRQGKPALATAGDRSRPQFSASRSGRLAVLAVGGEHPVGVDVERVRPGFSYTEIVDAFFARADRELLARLPRAQRLRAFFSIWTRYEACAKARGVGVAAHLEATEPVDRPAWIRPLSVASGYVATLAGDGRAGEVTVAPWPLVPRRREVERPV